MNEQLSKWLRKYQSYSHGEYFYDPEVEGVSEVCYGDIKHNEDGEYIEVPFCTYSDYSGGTVERSNCQTFLDMFKEFNEISMWKIYGGYCTTGVLIRRSLYENSEEVRDVIDGLFDYPLISDDDLSQLEIDLEQVSWETWLEYDLKRELDKQEIEYNEDELQSDMYYVMEYCNEYFIHEDACCPYLDVEKIVSNWVDAMDERRSK